MTTTVTSTTTTVVTPRINILMTTTKWQRLLLQLHIPGLLASVCCGVPVRDRRMTIWADNCFTSLLECFIALTSSEMRSVSGVIVVVTSCFSQYAAARSPLVHTGILSLDVKVTMACLTRDDSVDDDSSLSGASFSATLTAMLRPWVDVQSRLSSMSTYAFVLLQSYLKVINLNTKQWTINVGNDNVCRTVQLLLHCVWQDIKFKVPAL